VVKAIVGLGYAALADMAASENDTEATCDFCGKRYYFPPTAIREILESAS
jgi:redox-regulated HSP33 family molecular chaperone